MKRTILAVVVAVAALAGVLVNYWNQQESTVDLSDTVPDGAVEYIEWYDQVCTVITENRARAQRLSQNPHPRYSEAWAHREVQALAEWTRAGGFDRARQRVAKLREINQSDTGLIIDRMDELAARVELAEMQHRCTQDGRAPQKNINQLQSLAQNNGLIDNRLASRWLEQYIGQLSGNPESCDQYGNLSGEPGLIERSKEKGISSVTRAGGVITEDLTDNGQLDIVVSSHGFQEQLRIFVGDSKANGQWTDRTIEMGLEGMPGGLNIVQADYNNDGWMDLYISRGGWLMSKGEVPDSLLKNVDGERFVDVTGEAGLWAEAPTQVAQWQDYNGDGHLDLFVGYESQAHRSMGLDGDEQIDPASSEIYINKLFRNRGDGTFEDVSEAVGLDDYGFVKGASWGQLVGDEYPDLLVSVYGGKNVLYENVEGENGERVFRNYHELEAPIFSFATWVWDINHDGLDDIFIANFRVPMEAEVAPLMGESPQGPASELFINRGEGQFERMGHAVGLDQFPMSVMGANFGDLDNDGDFEVYLGTGEPSLVRWVPNRLLSWEGEQGRFVEHTERYNLGVMDKGHGIAFADLNRDGRQDIYASFGGWFEADESRNRYFENHLENDNSWVQLILEGSKSNRSAIGARVEIQVVDVEGVRRSFFHTVNSGGSFGANSLTVSAGLGEIDHIEEVVVIWPRKGFPTERYRGIESNRRWRLVESSGKPEPVY